MTAPIMVRPRKPRPPVNLDYNPRPEIGQVRLIEGVPSVVTSGYYTDPTYGRISNFFTWAPILNDGSLGKEKSGYAGDEFGKLLKHTVRYVLEK